MSDTEDMLSTGTTTTTIETSTSIHCCLDIRGALGWPKRRLGRLMRLTDGIGINRWATPEETREQLLDQIAMGHKVLPIGDPCEGFSYETGCPGHPNG